LQPSVCRMTTLQQSVTLLKMMTLQQSMISLAPARYLHLSPYRTVEQKSATSHFARPTFTLPESLNAKASRSRQAFSDAPASVSSSPVLECGLDSRFNRKLRPPAGSRQSDLDQMAFDVVAMAQRSWPKSSLDRARGSDGMGGLARLVWGLGYSQTVPWLYLCR
jgi:hypothetical protein